MVVTFDQYEQKEQKLPKVTLASAGVRKKESFVLQRIARVPEQDFERHVEKQQKEGAELTTASVLKLETALKFAHRKSPPLPVGKFSVIYADPPWSYEYAHSNFKKVGNDYPTMSLGEICSMGEQIQGLAAEDCTFFPWIPSPHLSKFPAILDAWGSRYCTCWVWHKLKRNFSF